MKNKNKNQSIVYCIYIFIWLLAFTWMLLSTGMSQAQDHSNQISFGALELPPYVLYDENGYTYGLIIDIFRKFEEQSDREIIILPYPPQRLSKYIKKGIVDCTIYIRTKSTESEFDPVVYLGVDLNSAVIAKTTTKLSSYEDLKILRLGISRGTAFGHKIDTDTELTKVFSQDYRQLAEMLIKDRVDAIIGIDKSLLYNLKEMGIPANLIGPPLILVKNELWLFCSRQTKLTQQDIDYIRDGFEEIKDTGKIDIIIKHYLP